MESDNGERFVYQLRVWLREISPAIWRRLLVRSDSTIADLHYTLQIAMGWTDFHLHQFIIHGKRYGVSRVGGIWFADDPHKVRLCDLQLREKGRFLYEYDFGDLWQHEIRVERKLTLDPKKAYPRLAETHQASDVWSRQFCPVAEESDWWSSDMESRLAIIESAGVPPLFPTMAIAIAMVR